MKTIQKLLLMAITLLMAGTQTSCTDYQDEIDALDYRVTVLENLVKKMNLDLESMTVIVGAMENGDYITNVTKNSLGYIITFNDAGSIVITDGVDGKDGKDAEVPDIGLKQDTDGQWYWTLNGDWITAPDGTKVRADGKDGRDGKDAVSPQVRINDETGEWEISVDGGITWSSTGTKATGRDGTDGTDGKNGNQFIKRVYYDINSDGEFMVIETYSGQTFRIPIYQNT